MDLLKNIFKGDKVVWIIFLLLCLISITEVFSAASTLTYKTGNHLVPITQHATYLLFGVLVVIIVHNIPYKWFQLIPIFLLPLSVGLLIFVLLMGILHGHYINGAARWMDVFGISFQPSELAKMAVVATTAFILSKGQTEDGAQPKAFKHILIVVGLVCLLIVRENFSTAALLFATVFLMMFIGRVQARKLLGLTGVLIAGMCLFVVCLLATPKDTLRQFGQRLPVWKDRITGFASAERVPPTKVEIDDNAQVVHARIAVATSHVIGKGPGNSVQRDFLSQAFSDFIYAIIIEELGLVGGIVVVFLYICLLVRVGKIAKKCNRTFPAFLITGIGLLLVLQALFNMMVAVGLAPVTGQPLPLISKGGTSTLVNCAYIGMILSVSRYTQKLDEQRRHDAMIPLTISTGAPDEPAYVPQDDNLSIAEPTAKTLNDDSELV